MGFNKKKKNIKELDNVFQMIEEKENIIETEEEKENRINKDAEMKKFRVLLIILLIGLILLTIGYVIYSVYENSISNYANLKSKNRDEYIIRSVDETLLKNYLQPGKNTIVAFWASWCPHCQDEAAALNEFITKNKNANIIVVSHDRNIDSLITYLENNYNYNWFVIYDTERLIRESIDPKASTIPRTYLLDDDGNIINKIERTATLEDLTNLYNQTIKE